MVTFNSSRKSQVKAIIGFLREMIGTDEKTLSMLNILELHYYGSSQPDMGARLKVSFQPHLDEHFKRIFIQYATEGKVFEYFYLWLY